MHKFIRATFVASASTSFALCAAAHAQSTTEQTPAPAPEPPAAPQAPQAAPPPPESGRTSSLAEVVVTARRVRENLQDVPTAVTAVNADQIRDLQITSFETAGQTAPNVYIQKQAGTPLAPQFNIRGSSTGNDNLESDAGIGLYIDGIYIGRPAASGFDIGDIDHIEVLRGPQGTLFGRNATGGAINIVTAAPTGHFGLNGELTFGDYMDRRQKVGINLPAWNGLSAKVQLSHAEHDAYVQNTFSPVTYQFSGPFGAYTTSTGFGDSDQDTVSAAVRYTGIDNLKVDYKYEYSQWTGTIDGRQLLSLDPGFVAQSNFAAQPTLGGTNVVGLDYLKAFPSNFDSPAHFSTYGHTLTAAYDFSSSLTLKNIAGYRAYNSRSGLDNLDGNAFVDPTGATKNPYTTLSAIRIDKQDQISDELQLIGHLDKLEWIGGLFFFDEKGQGNAPVFLGRTWSLTSVNAVGIGDYIAGQNTTVNNRSEAAYLHGTYHLLSDWDLSGGVRYTKDKRKEMVLADFATFASTGAIPGLTGFAPGSTFEHSGNRADYDGSVTYKIRKNMNVYVKTASGYISGGVLNGLDFKPETITSYEGGLKSDFWGKRLRVNAATFYQTRDNLQILGFTAPPGSFIFDGGKEQDSGVELETFVVPLEGLTINASYGYTHAHNDAGVRGYQPKHTASAGLMYEAEPIAYGMMPAFRIDMNYRSDAYRLPCQAGVAEDPVTACATKSSDSPNPTLDHQLILKSEVTLGARMTLSEIPLGDKTKGRISAWATNLLDNHNYQYLFPVSGQQTVGIFDAPRTFGVDLSLNY